MSDEFNKMAGKFFNWTYQVMDKAGLFSEERMKKAEEAERRDEELRQRRPGVWVAKKLGKSALLYGVLMPLGGELLGEVWHRVKK
jgi:hypothetical protein